MGLQPHSGLRNRCAPVQPPRRRKHSLVVVRPYLRYPQQLTVLLSGARASSVAVCVSPTPPYATASAWRKPGSGVRYLLEEIDNRKRLHSALGYRSGESTRLCVRRLQRRSIPTDSPVHPQGVTESSLRDRPVRQDRKSVV